MHGLTEEMMLIAARQLQNEGLQPKQKLVSKILHVAYQRNGISGKPYSLVSFINFEGEQLLAIVFNDPGYCAVFDPSSKKGSQQRGDEYEPELRQGIEFERA